MLGEEREERVLHLFERNPGLAASSERHGEVWSKLLRSRARKEAAHMLDQIQHLAQTAREDGNPTTKPERLLDALEAATEQVSLSLASVSAPLKHVPHGILRNEGEESSWCEFTKARASACLATAPTGPIASVSLSYLGCTRRFPTWSARLS